MADVSIYEMWNEALSAYRQGNRKAAKDIFTIISTTDARITFNLACIYIEEKNYPAALKLLKNSLEKDNTLSVAYFQRAYIRYQQGNFDSAHKNYLKTIMSLGNKKQVGFRSQGLEITLCEDEIRMNMSFVNQAKKIMEKRGSYASFKLFAIPPGTFFCPVVPVQTEQKKKKGLKIDTNAQVISQLPKPNVVTPLLNGEIKESPGPLADKSPGASSSMTSRSSLMKMPYFTPISPEHIRIKIFWNSNDAMAILSHRYVLLSDLVRQIRSKLQIDFDPTLANPKTGKVLAVDSQVWNHLEDPACIQFQIRIIESI